LDRLSWVFDFGVNRAAVTTFKVPANVAASISRGAAWTQQASEALACAKPCGINHFPGPGGSYAAEVLTYAHDPAVLPHIDWTPRHTQMGFRYIQLNFSTAASADIDADAAWEPDNNTLTMRWINTAAEPIAEIFMQQGGGGGAGSRETGGDAKGLLNQIQALHLTSARSNWMSIPTDCPQVRHNACAQHNVHPHRLPAGTE
jgi:hypothetical protein